MVFAVMLAMLLHRPSLRMNVFALALLIILLLSPVAVLTIGFWFSFMSVLFIFIAVRAFSHHGKLKKIIYIQLYLSAAVLPLSLFFFQGVLISPLANLISIPLVSFVISPLNLITQCLFIIEPGLVTYLIGWLDNLLTYLVRILTFLASCELSKLQYHINLSGLLIYQL